MLVHGELRGWSRLRMELHLLHCSECRSRRRRMGSLTLSLAQLLQNPSLGHRTFRTASRMAWSTMALAALFVSGGWFAANALSHGEQPAAATVAGSGVGLRSCETHSEPEAVALASKKKKLQHPKRKHDNPDK